MPDSHTISGPLVMAYCLGKDDDFGPRTLKTVKRDRCIAALARMRGVTRFITRVSLRCMHTSAARLAYVGALAEACQRRGMALSVGGYSPQKPLAALDGFEHDALEESLVCADQAVVGPRIRFLDLEAAVWRAGKTVHWTSRVIDQVIAAIANVAALRPIPLLLYHPMLNPGASIYARNVEPVLRAIAADTPNVCLLDAAALYYRPSGHPAPTPDQVRAAYEPFGFSPDRVVVGMISRHAGPSGWSAPEFGRAASSDRRRNPSSAMLFFSTPEWLVNSDVRAE